MLIEILTIPHSEQRYPTCGDYWEEEDTLHVRISALSDVRYEWLVLIHELVEYALVKLAGIELRSIDDFDETFDGEGEPGDDSPAPYHYQHVCATAIERVFAVFLGVDWTVYDREVDAL